MDYRATEDLHVNAVLLPGLSGRYTPASSAEILGDSFWGVGFHVVTAVRRFFDYVLMINMNRNMMI